MTTTPGRLAVLGLGSAAASAALTWPAAAGVVPHDPPPPRLPLPAAAAPAPPGHWSRPVSPGSRTTPATDWALVGSAAGALALSAAGAGRLIARRRQPRLPRPA